MEIKNFSSEFCSLKRVSRETSLVTSGCKLIMKNELMLQYMYLLCQRLDSVHSSHPKCSKSVHAGSPCTHSNGCDPQVCRECQMLARFHVQEVSVRFHLGVCLGSNSQEVQEVPAREWVVWAKLKFVVLEPCRDRVRDQPTSSSRMCVTSLHKDILGQCQCSLKSRSRSSFKYL